MLQSMNLSFRSIIGKRIGAEPSRISSRIAFLALILCGFIMITSYRAILVAFLTKDNDEPPVRDIMDIRSSDYRLAIMKNDALEEIFTHASPDSEENRIKASNKIYRFSNKNSHIDQMVNGDSGVSKTILFFSRMGVIFNKHYPCSLTEIQTHGKMAIRNDGMIFKKDWPFTELFNFHLLIMKEKGVLDRLLERYLNTIQKSCPDDQTIRPILKRPRPIGTEKTIFLYLILGSGFLFSFIWLVLEVLHHSILYCH